METKPREERRLKIQNVGHRYTLVSLKLLSVSLKLPQNKVINKIILVIPILLTVIVNPAADQQEASSKRPCHTQ